MNPDEVRRAIAVPFRSFLRSKESVHPCDYFEDVACFVYYDTNARAEAVEFARSAKVVLDDLDLFSTSYAGLEGFMKSVDQNLQMDDDGFTSFARGVGVWAPAAADEPEQPPESIIVFSRGYFGREYG